MNMPAREEITSPRFKIKSSCLLWNSVQMIVRWIMLWML
jgi:hypothetical protein